MQLAGSVSLASISFCLLKAAAAAMEKFAWCLQSAAVMINIRTSVELLLATIKR